MSSHLELIDKLAIPKATQRVGRVVEAYGTLIRATGLQAKVGELCVLRDPATGATGRAEVIGIMDGLTVLTPLGTIRGISQGTEVSETGTTVTIGVGNAMLGRVVDAYANPIDGKGPIAADTAVPLRRNAPAPFARSLVDRPVTTGIRSIDGLMTIGRGQRLGVFAAAGVGKSTLLSQLASGSEADVNVIVLLGERGREVREFVEHLGAEGMRKSVVVVATSDRPALERSHAAYTGTAIAEFLRAQGLHVMLLLDSVTRFARALRDVALSVGEPPARRGYPPSVFSELPSLFERAGNDEHGAMTAFYSVLVEDEESSDPIAEEVQSILDGHIHLSRKLAAKNHYPAIDVGTSLSRLMNQITSHDHKMAAARYRELLAKYDEIELLVQIGEYTQGQDYLADEAVKRLQQLNQFAQQDVPVAQNIEETVANLLEAVHGPVESALDTTIDQSP